MVFNLPTPSMILILMGSSSSYLYSLIFLILILIFSSILFPRLLLQWRHPQLNPTLPPGSLGWPYLGETFKLYTAQHSHSFFSSRLQRYGEVFKTHILGCPCVMVARAEAVRNVLVNEAHLFKPTYPPSKEKLIGPEAVFFQQGPYHSLLKKFIQASFLPSAIKNYVSQVECILFALLPTWLHSTSINTLQEMKQYAFEVAVFSAFGDKKELEVKQIKNLYLTLEKGYNCFPINLPGTSYRRSIQARKVLNKSIMKLMQRREERKNYDGGLLGVLLRARSLLKCHLTDSQIADNLIGVIFAAHDTTASLLTWVIKYLHDHPPVLQNVTKEQEAIRSKLIEENRGLMWDDTRQMHYTLQVIQETLRCANILSFTYREVVTDVVLEGYSIPRGWKVLPLFRRIHESPDFYPQPHKFDPSRFEEAPRPNTYMPFGIGVHSCPGSEMAKLEVLILLHHLTLSYRWQVVGDVDGIEHRPFPVPKHGLPIKISLKLETSISP